MIFYVYLFYDMKPFQRYVLIGGHITVVLEILHSEVLCIVFALMSAHFLQVLHFLF